MNNGYYQRAEVRSWAADETGNSSAKGWAKTQLFLMNNGAAETKKVESDGDELLAGNRQQPPPLPVLLLVLLLVLLGLGRPVARAIAGQGNSRALTVQEKEADF